ncbi:unnamed protein product [Cuscuta campestris]|uniref:Uncharacterized protein n=1 Tax=Cuscuta campestris TaxID=132261 RepID=A0A484M1S3_9ASTE|nr:unnamed protein product [Cuscuta campestris]
MVIPKLILEAHSMFRALVEYLISMGLRRQDSMFREAFRGSSSRVGTPTAMAPPPPCVPTSFKELAE